VNYIPFSMIKSIHEQTHSAHPNAPVIPHRPRRHPIRAVRRLFQSRRPVSQPAPQPASVVAPLEARPTLALVPDAGLELCEAEVRDRGTTTASAARAC
jgi:hypothetical protein